VDLPSTWRRPLVDLAVTWPRRAASRSWPWAGGTWRGRGQIRRWPAVSRPGPWEVDGRYTRGTRAVVCAPALKIPGEPRLAAWRYAGLRGPGSLATVNSGNLAAWPLPGALPRRMAAGEGTWPGTPARRPGRCPGGQLSRPSCTGSRCQVSRPAAPAWPGRAGLSLSTITALPTWGAWASGSPA